MNEVWIIVGSLLVMAALVGVFMGCMINAAFDGLRPDKPPTPSPDPQRIG